MATSSIHGATSTASTATTIRARSGRSAVSIDVDPWSSPMAWVITTAIGVTTKNAGM